MYRASKFAFVEDEEDEELMLDDNLNSIIQPQFQGEQQSSTTTTTTTTPLSQQQQQQQQQQAPTQSKGFLASLFGSKAPQQDQYSQSPQQPQKPTTTTINNNQVKTKVKKANTNVLVINLGTVAKDSLILTGDATFCKNCKSGFSNINSFTEVLTSDGEKVQNVPTAGGFDKDSKIWKCEFCAHENQVELDQEEIPNINVIDYILESEPLAGIDVNNNNVTKSLEEKEKSDESDESMVLFCIDISGSMEVTSSVNNFPLPVSIALPPGSTIPQGKTHQSVNYVTRLQCVQLGLLSQIESVAKKYPNKRVGIVTFNSAVQLIGDGSKPPVTISDSKVLNNLSQLVEEGNQFQFDEPIVKTKSDLIDRVTRLRGNGSTAMGSAIAACIGITNAKRGSQIIICTDGETNIGLQGGENFELLGQMAQRAGTALSVLTIKGTNTKLELIGKLANTTGGEVNILDPVNLNEGFKEVLSLPTLATNVSIKLFLHSGLYISENGKRTENHFHERTVGNVNQDTTISFEYGVKSSKLIDKSLKSIPFQLQIYYTTLTGKKCVRFITQTQEITTDAELAEDHALLDVLGINMVQTSSKIASTGDYESSRAKNITNAGLMQKIMQKKQQKQRQQQNSQQPPQQQEQEQEKEQLESASNYLQQAQELEIQLTNTVQKESKGGVFSSSGDKLKSRQSKRDDATANMLYNMSSMNSSKSKKSYL